MSAKFGIEAREVFPAIERWMLRDGYDIVIDMERSKGSHVIDAVTGDNWLDFYTFFASSPFGMNPDRLMTPEFKDKIFHAAVNKVSNSDIYTLEMGEFVKTFGEIAKPEGFEHLYFVDTGTLAVENALKVAMDWKVQKLLARGKITPGEAADGAKGAKVIHFNEAFHGRGGFTLSLTNTADPNKHQRFAKFNDWPRVINPKITFPLAENLGTVEWLEAQAIKQINRAIDNDPDGHCAIIIETIQGEGGDNHFRPEFFRKLREICDARELMLIFDEVQCGMGITGAMWAWQKMGVAPDIFAFAKKSQVSGIAVSKRVDEVENNCFKVSSRINSTWGGNIADMVRGTEYLKIYRDENVLDNVNKVGAVLLKGLEELQAEFPGFIRNARGSGLMCAFDIASTELRAKFIAECTKRRMLILQCGTHTVRFRPALNVPQADIELGLSISREAAKAAFK